MWQTKVLNTKEHKTEWGNLVDALPSGDIFFTPEYAQLFESADGEAGREFGGEAQLFFYGDDEDYVIYPFFKRKISELPFPEAMGSAAEGWYDIASPYGYNGPLARITNPELENALWQEFLDRFHQYCLSNNIVAEFARLHPYLKNHTHLQSSKNSRVRSRPPVVYIDLRQDEALMRKGMTKGNKSSIAKAHRSGIEIRISPPDKEAMLAFHRLYTATMARHQARPAYFFSQKFIDNAFRMLGEQVKLFCAWHHGQIIAASLFLCRGKFVHYFLSGSDENSLSLCPNNLLLYEAILWAKGQGYELFNLGGGYEANDSLFQFKSSFAKTTADFFIYSRVHNEEMYRRLCEAREKYDTSQGRQATRPDFFPRYRS